MLQIPAIQQNHSPVRGTEKITDLKAQPKRGSGDFGDEKITLFEPSHVAPIDVFGTDAAVRRLPPDGGSGPRARPSLGSRI